MYCAVDPKPVACELAVQDPCSASGKVLAVDPKYTSGKNFAGDTYLSGASTSIPLGSILPRTPFPWQEKYTDEGIMFCTKPFGYDKRVVAQSPRESAGVIHLRNIIRSREVCLVQAEARLERHEDLLERWEQRIEQREILVDQKEARLHSTSLALEAEKKKHEDEKLAQEKKKLEEEKAAQEKKRKKVNRPAS